ncbi:FAD/NAD(P)-binding domain-containing protein [Clavulina sp. PMI_390]|nr:FAD/NAD(P)-binding domain-containing protein [Clavulina sp. PMI_390]
MLTWNFWLGVVLYGTSVCVAQDHFTENNDSDSADGYYHLPHPVRRVAVIGAGPAGLQFASTLLNHGFEVRMFERAPKPGGIWYYTERLPVPATFPNRPIETMAYVPDIPKQLPATRIYVDGQDGLTVDWRIREHWVPSSIWFNMTTIDAYASAILQILQPWRPARAQVTRHVRQYASSVGLNSNDEEHANVTSYWTRVERVEKVPGTEKRWTLTLRKLTPLRDGTLEVNWWQEQFDAVVVGKFSDNDAAWVPPIPGLKEWAQSLPNNIFHSRNYRRPQLFENQNVLIVGGSLSGIGIANDLIGHARSVTVSIRDVPSNPLLVVIRSWFHKNVTFISEIESFHNRPSALQGRLQGASLTLTNGTVVSGYDAIILATGYRQSLPFLKGYHNSTIKGFEEPETDVAPIITDGTHLRSLHWTGHYIDDPTLLLCTKFPWAVGTLQYQALGAAKVWSRKARLPSIAKMWQSYPGAAGILPEHPILSGMRTRLFLTWLNDEALEFGGPLVASPDLDSVRELLRYYTAKEYPRQISDFFEPGGFPSGERPRSQWDIYNGASFEPASFLNGDLATITKDSSLGHWADLSLQW